MTFMFARSIVLPAIVVLALAGTAAAQTAGDANLVEVKNGTAAFEVGTNVGAISVHGKSNDLTARLRMRQSPDGAVLEGIEAAVPVKSIGTGMGLRDSHMRKYVFTTADGQVPDLKFSADKAAANVDYVRSIVNLEPKPLMTGAVDKPEDKQAAPVAKKSAAADAKKLAAADAKRGAKKKKDPAADDRTDDRPIEAASPWATQVAVAKGAR